MIHILQILSTVSNYLVIFDLDGNSIRSDGFSYICLQEVGQICFPAIKVVLSVDTQYVLLSYRAVLQEVLDQKPAFRSLKQDVLPYLVRTQLVSRIRSLQMTIFFLLPF